MKVLCVSLTPAGKSHLDDLRAEAMRLGEDPRKYIIAHIPETPPRTYYHQVPFDVSDESCTLVDLRQREKVIKTLGKYAESGNADTCWS